MENSLWPLWVAAPFFALLVQVAAHVICLRTLPIIAFHSFLIGAVMGLLTQIAFVAYLAIEIGFDPVEMGLPSVLTFLCLAYSYFHFFNLGETGRRLRLMRELYDSPNGLTADELLERYTEEEVIMRRLDRLRAGGQVVVEGDRVYPGKAGVAIISAIFPLFKLLIMGRRWTDA